MQAITAKNNQLLIDITMQVAGDAGALYQLAAEQGISITAALNGASIVTGETPATAAALSIAKLLNAAGFWPASGDDANDVASITGSLPFVISLQVQPTGKMVQHEQCLVDLAMQYLGNAADVFALASSLGLSITEQLTAGDVYTMPAKSLQAAEKRLAALLSAPMHWPASSEHLNAVASITGSLPFIIGLQRPLSGKVAQYAQCLVDLAMQHMGDAADLFTLASSLGLSITTQITAGDVYNIPAKSLQALDKKLIALLNEIKNIPASDVDADGPPNTPKLEGIDYWFVYEYVVR